MELSFLGMKVLGYERSMNHPCDGQVQFTRPEKYRVIEYKSVIHRRTHRSHAADADAYSVVIRCLYWSNVDESEL